MTIDKEYSGVDRKNRWVKNPLVSKGKSFEDNRGIIESLISFPEAEIGSVVLIETKKGSLRANHYHKEDWHYCYVVSGSIEYHCRPVGSDATPKMFLIGTGDIFYTPPLVEHAMVFPEDTTFLAFSGGTRLQEDYEKDLVRVNLL
jgi:quercetin dioxygenase-like cupin family protein